MEYQDAHQYGDLAITKYYDPQLNVGLGSRWAEIQELLAGEALSVQSPRRTKGGPVSPTPSDAMVSMYKSDRVFRLWEYRVSHSQLLLRSPQNGSQSTNIDIAALGVSWIEMPTTLRGVRLQPASLHAQKLLNSSDSSAIKFVLSSEGMNYAISAATCIVLENELDIFKSPLESFKAGITDCDPGQTLWHFP